MSLKKEINLNIKDIMQIDYQRHYKGHCLVTMSFIILAPIYTKKNSFMII